MNILVTGGSGSIGSELVAQCLAQGHKVIVFSRDEIKHFIMRRRFNNPNLITEVGDVRNISSLERVFVSHHIDIIYHCAAMKHVVMCEEFPIECNQTNVQGTQNVVDLALRYNPINQFGTPRTILISTDKAANPSTVMGASKLMAERITLNGSLRGDGQVFSAVRFGNVANSRGSVIPMFVDALLRGKPIQVSNPNMTRFIMRIDEAVKMVIGASEIAHGGEVFILKMKAFRLGDLVDIMKDKGATVLPNYQYGYEKMHEDLVSELEVQRLYDWEGMYVLRPKPTGGKTALTKPYTSDSVPLLSKAELGKIVDEAISCST
jgi:UDP-N-acetylglucosamine 4,6-dehydratase